MIGLVLETFSFREIIKWSFCRLVEALFGGAAVLGLWNVDVKTPRWLTQAFNLLNLFSLGFGLTALGRNPKAKPFALDGSSDALDSGHLASIAARVHRTGT